MYYQKALKAQNQYRNLHHISFWEMAIANLALWDIPTSLDYWRTLAAEATVSLYSVLLCVQEDLRYLHAASDCLVVSTLR